MAPGSRQLASRHCILLVSQRCRWCLHFCTCMPSFTPCLRHRQVKRDLRMLRLRGAFDPKRFYKSADATKFPKYFQMGTVVEGPTDFYSGAWPP